MTDKQPMQAMDNHRDTAKPKANDGIEWPSGKGEGGESNGGAYPNPHTGKGSKDNVGGGFLGHGGQSGMDYSGPGDGDTDDTVGNENAVTK